MNHPNEEQWMSYLYGETSAEEESTLAAHLRQCEACSRRVEQWQGTRKELDAWRLRPAGGKPKKQWGERVLARPFLRWAAAIALLAAGAGFGRFTGTQVGIQKLRAAMVPEIRQQLRQEFETKRIEDLRSIYAAMEKLHSQHLADYVSLKKELDTVAVLTDASLRNAEQELTQLANYAEAAGLPASSQSVNNH